MAYQYKLEYQWDDEDPADDGVYIQQRVDVPKYLSHIDKEAYEELEAEDKHAFTTGLLDVAGVTELSSRAYRVWIMKSPVYSWEEVLTATLLFLKDWYSETELEELPGSAKIEGVGTRLQSVRNRRDR